MFEDTVDDVFLEFCKIGRLERLNANNNLVERYDAKIEEAFQRNGSIAILNRKREPWSLHEDGGRLLGNFIRRHPAISDIHIPNHQMNSKGWDAFVGALADTKHLGHLQVLTISFTDSYDLEMLRSLGEKVLCDHPSLHTLNLNSCFFNDRSIACLTPYLRMPSLQSLNLAKSSFDGRCLEGLIQQLRGSCPKLAHLNLQGCGFEKQYSPLLVGWMEANHELCITVSESRYEDIRNRLNRNRRETFIPTHLAAVQQDLAQLVSSYTDLQTRVQALEERRGVEDNHMQQRVKELEDTLTALREEFSQANVNMTRAVTEKFEAAANALADSVKEMVDDALEKMHSVEKAYASIASGQDTLTTELETMQRSLEGTRQEMSLLSGQIGGKTDHLNRIEEATSRLTAEIAALKAAQPIIQNLVRTINDLSEAIWETNTENYSTAEVLFIRHFRRVFVQVHQAAMVIHSGFVALQDSSTMNTASKLLSTLSSAAPMGSGIALQVVAFCLQNASNAIVKQRLERILSLGITSEEVSRVALAVGKALMPVLMSLDNPVKTEFLKKVFDAAGSVAETVDQFGLFFGALAHVSSTTTENIISSNNHNVTGTLTLSEEEAVERAERDAQLLVALLMKYGVPLSYDLRPDVDSLVFLGLPWLAIAQRVYGVILQRFCVRQCPHLTVSDLHVKSQKRGLFRKNLMEAWQRYDRARLTTILGRNPQSMETFAVALGETYYATHTEALHFKPHPVNIHKYHLSWKSEFLSPDTFDNLLRDVLPTLVTP